MKLRQSKLHIYQPSRQIVWLFVIFILSIVTIVVYFFQKINKQAINRTDLWLVSTDSEDLVCWEKDTCVWSWSHKDKLDNNLITERGVLKKSFPTNIKSKTKLLAVDKVNNNNSPVTDFYFDDQIFVFTLSDGYTHKVYLYLKKDKSLKLLFTTDKLMWLAKVRPDRQVALFGQSNYLKSEKNEYFVVDLNSGKMGDKFTFDTFDWSSSSIPDHYKIGFINKCNPADVDAYNCPIFSGLFNCPSYINAPTSLLSQYTNLFFADKYFLNLPEGWDKNMTTNEIYNQKFQDQLIVLKQSCSSYFGNLYPQNLINMFTVDLSPAKITVLSKPQLYSSQSDSSSEVYIVAVAEVIHDYIYYQFLLTTSYPMDKSETKSNVKVLTNMLSSLRFYDNFK